MKSIKVRLFSACISLASIICALPCMYVYNICAEETVENIEGRIYEFGKSSTYDYSHEEDWETSGDSDVCGVLALNGNLEKNGTENSFVRYGIDGENVTFSYTFDDTYLDADEDEWHLVSDDVTWVDKVNLKTRLGKGVLIVQSSKNGENWYTDTVITNAFEDSSDQEEFYSTKDIQLTNGTYFRVIAAYCLKMQVGKNHIGPIATTDKYDYEKIAEVYEFYLYDVNTEEKTSDMTNTKYLGSLVNTGKDNGFSGTNEISYKDPHYGWEIGKFFVSGYTRETQDSNGNPVFLKNVGDEVTLWFNLEQDIDELDGDSDLTIYSDVNGYDQYFQTGKTKMGRGALIVRFTDYQGIKHEPEIYTDYLEANASTSADTIVKLFEEGDYEVALDYEIKNTPREVIGMEIAPEFTNYRIFFKFSVRNGNCMVYPFDISTGAELSDEAITPNGFKLDLARSRYLNIDVQRAVVTEGNNGYVEDIRFNRPAKDGDAYTDEGIYTFSVKNLYTGETTTKKIYVGDTAYMNALSVNKLTVRDLNMQIEKGASINENGTITLPTPTPEPSPEPTVEEKPDEKETVGLEVANEEDNKTTSDGNPVSKSINETAVDSEKNQEKESEDVNTSDEKEKEDKANSKPVGLIVVCLLAAMLMAGFIITMNKRRQGK